MEKKKHLMELHTGSFYCDIFANHSHVKFAFFFVFHTHNFTTVIYIFHLDQIAQLANKKSDKHFR